MNHPTSRHPECRLWADEGSPYHNAARVFIKHGRLGDPSRGMLEDGAGVGAQGDEFVGEQRCD
jgi:hypothetical protein